MNEITESIQQRYIVSDEAKYVTVNEYTSNTTIPIMQVVPIWILVPLN